MDPFKGLYQISMVRRRRPNPGVAVNPREPYLVTEACKAADTCDKEQYEIHLLHLQQLFARELGARMHLYALAGPRPCRVNSPHPLAEDFMQEVGDFFESKLMGHKRVELVELSESDDPNLTPACGYHKIKICLLVEKRVQQGLTALHREKFVEVNADWIMAFLQQREITSLLMLPRVFESCQI